MLVVTTPPSPLGQVIVLVPSPLLTTVHETPVLALAGAGIVTDVPSGQTIILAPPSGLTMVQLVAPASLLGMGTFPPRVALVPSEQDIVFTPASFGPTVQVVPFVPFLPSEPEQAARQTASAAET
jgi:hypothetical protein